MFYSTTQDFVPLVCLVNTKIFTAEKPSATAVTV